MTDAFFLHLLKILKMKIFIFFISFVIVISCTTKQEVDVLVIDAKIYTVNKNFDTAEAMAIQNGKIIAIGSTDEVTKKYQSKNIVQAQGKVIVPGLYDAHAHLYNLGIGLQTAELRGLSSKEETLDKLIQFQEEKKLPFITGRGWDQNDWPDKKYPTAADLDSIFPDTPVALSRVDGHALWVNSKALALAGITEKTKINGGEVVLQNGKPTGILIDTPMNLVFNIIPKPTRAQQTQALLEATAICLENGLTTINDAGLDKQIIQLIDSLQKEKLMKLKVYAMVSNTPENLEYYLNKGIIKTSKLNVRSIKIYGDGALGSRGAALKQPYTDLPHHYGAMITQQEILDSLALKIEKAGYQMNTHAIGDSANIAVIRAYQKALSGKTDKRWKIEHAQVVSKEDFKYFSNNIIPSVQPTHATSDMYWAEDRIGKERIKGAYAYKKLLKKAGIVVLGTDFPVEKVNPMHTFYAAVARKDLQQYPKDGFRPEEALTREEALKGMTIWAAYSNFEENEKGSLEVGKAADFTVLNTDIMNCPENQIPNIKVLQTFIDGERVFTLN